MPTPSRTRRSWSSQPSQPGSFPARPTSALPSGPGAVYRRRRPTRTPLYPIVQHHLETFLARARAEDEYGSGVPDWVEEDFRAYLRCGILAHGFARVRCDGCATERLVAFSCKGRGTCPSCGARRMVEAAAHLNDAVLPPVPIRQWVLSLPKRLRPYLPHDPELAGAILRVLLRAIQTRLRRTSPGSAPDARLGAVSFLHRFGSSLNPHFHFHVVVLDGLFSEEPDGTVRFDEATHLTGDDAQHLQRLLQRLLQRRILRLFQRRGLLEPATVENMLTWQGSGGFSLDASVRIHGTDRSGRERLLRYCARPPFALERMSLEHGSGANADAEAAAGDGSGAAGGERPIRRVLYLPARPLPDGRSVLALSPLEFLAALSRLIPPPRVHRHRYHGVLAPNARLRAGVVALAREHTAALEEPAATAGNDVSEQVAGTAGVAGAAGMRGAGGAGGAGAPDNPPVQLPPLEPAQRAARSRWARLIARIYEVSPLSCPNCGAEMRILALITDPGVIGAILSHLDLPTRPPARSPARGPPQPDLPLDGEAPDHLDQTPAFDAAEPDPIPDFDFDQS